MINVEKRKVSLFISQHKCIGCEICVNICFHNVLGMTYQKDECYATVEYPDRCTACEKCQKICPSGAIEINNNKFKLIKR